MIADCKCQFCWGLHAGGYSIPDDCLAHQLKARVPIAARPEPPVEIRSDDLKPGMILERSFYPLSVVLAVRIHKGAIGGVYDKVSILVATPDGEVAKQGYNADTMHKAWA